MKKKKEQMAQAAALAQAAEAAEAAEVAEVAEVAQATEATHRPTEDAEAAVATDEPTAPADPTVAAAATEEAAVAAAVTEAASPATEAKDERALLAAFLAALSPTERQTLVAVLTRLSDGEREREARAARAEEEAILSEMEKVPVFRGIGARAEALRALAGAVDWLGALPVRERLAAAFYIDRGMRYGEPTREDLLHAVLSDEALMRELAQRRREATETTKKTLPPVHARRGSAGMPATVKSAPKTLSEATGEAKKYLRFYAR